MVIQLLKNNFRMLNIVICYHILVAEFWRGGVAQNFILNMSSSSPKNITKGALDVTYNSEGTRVIHAYNIVAHVK